MLRVFLYIVNIHKNRRQKSCVQLRLAVVASSVGLGVIEFDTECVRDTPLKIAVVKFDFANGGR